jgi:hypothetical protein
VSSVFVKAFCAISLYKEIRNVNRPKNSVLFYCGPMRLLVVHMIFFANGALIRLNQSEPLEGASSELPLEDNHTLRIQIQMQKYIYKTE